MKTEKKLTRELWKLGLSQVDAATEIGVTPGTVTKWVKGGKISAKYVNKIRALGVPIDAIMNASDDVQ